MFTGIIQSKGRVVSNTLVEGGRCIAVELGELDVSSITLGDSIACNGVCLTVVELTGKQAVFDVSNETLDKTLIGQWQVDAEINLETALTLQTPLGGHLVSGHVDGIGELRSKEADGDSTLTHFWVPSNLGRLVAAKGSVCLNGVSLTSNQIIRDDANENGVNGSVFSVTIVPHTFAATSLGSLAIGDKLHVEIDLIARYLDRIQRFDAQQSQM